MGTFLLLQTHAQEPTYLALEDPDAGSQWNADEPDLTDPDATIWNHDNGSDQWENALGIVDGGTMPGGVELLEQDGVEFLRFQDARTTGGDGDNRKIMFTANFDEEAGTDPLDLENGEGVTLHVRVRLADASQGLPLEDIFEGGPWPDGGDGTRVRFGGKGSMGVDTASGTFGFALGRADADEALIDLDGNPVSGLMLNGVTGGDEDGNIFLIPDEELIDWQEFIFHIIPEEGEEGSTHKVTLYHNGSTEGVDYFITPGDGNVGGATEPSLYFGHAATDHTGAFDFDFIDVKVGIHEPIPSMGSDPNVIWSRRSALGQLPTVPATTEGIVTLRNNGETMTLTLSNWAVSGPDAEHVTINDGPTEIAPGETADLRYTFNSLNETGAFSATITFDTNDPDTPNAAIEISASVINTEGPGGHYPLDDAANEEAELADITGYGRPGVYAEGTGALTFGEEALATGSSIGISGGASLQVPARKLGDITNYTATMWLNVSEVADPFGAVFSRGAITDANPAVSLLLAADGSFLWLAPEVDENPLFTIDPVLTLGTTAHLAIVAEGNHDKVSVYLDGQLVGSNEGMGEALPSEAGSFFFGAFGPLATDGTYDDIQVYTRALSAEDIATLAAAPGDVLRPEDPGAADSDSDGLSDAEEVALGTDPIEADTDGDGLSDGDEVNVYNTDPLNVDSDGDERSDGAEVAAGFDPNDKFSPAPAATGSLAGNIVAHWALDEADGTTVADAVGSNPGTVMGTAEWKPGEGQVDGAIFFDGSDGFIEVADAPEFRFAESESWAVSLWYRTDAVEDDQGLLTKGYHDDSRATTGYWQLQTRAGSFTVDSRCCEGGDPRARVDSDSGISHGDDQWHHFVVTRDGALQEIRLYVDGQRTTADVSGQDNGLWAMGDNDDPLVIANHFNRFTRGWFDDIAIWKGYALSDSDVAAIAGGVTEAISGGVQIGGPVELSITEEGLDGDEPAVVENAGTGYSEDALTFSDRTHEHNGAAFDSASGILDVNGDLVVPLPDYMTGQSYIRFANNARDNANYVGTVNSSGPTKWYLLVDNRLDGPSASTGSPNTEDPVLGGTLQWIIDGGWERVNTGISPNGQADYVGVDESGDGGLNQFYAVYTQPEPSTSIAVNSNGIAGSNMISLVGVGVTTGGGGDIAGLVGYWPLDTGADDASGNGVHGVVEAGDNAWVNDPERGAVYQSGGGSSIDLGDAVIPVLDASTDFTWSFWVNPNETANNNIVLGNRYSPDGTDFAPREFIKFTPTAFEWHFNDAGENVGNDETAFEVGVWSHNLVVKSGTTLTYYRNGVVIGSGEVTGNPLNPQPLYIGGQNGVENFSGLLDEVAIFNRALSPAEVTDVYNRGLNGQALTSGDGGGGPVDPGEGERPVLQEVGFTANGVFGVTVPDGLSVTIEYSTDLENWTPIGADLTGAVEETDAGRIAAPAGYYRAILP